MTMRSPAEIFRRHLIVQGVGYDETNINRDWVIFTGTIPDGDKVQIKDNAMCVYDFGGRTHGRLMAGETIRHEHIQIRIRAGGAGAYSVGYNKGNAIEEILNSIKRTLVIMDVVEYMI